MRPSLTKPYDQDALLNLLRAGNQKAFEELYDRFAPNLLGVLIRFVHDEKQAEDLLQDSFVKIWRFLPQYDPAKGRFFTWMLRIVQNMALTYLQQPQQRLLRIDDLAQETMGSVTPTYHSIGLAQWVDSCLAVHHRQVIDLVYFQGYTQQEVADEFGIALGTVKTRLRQALSRLRTSEMSSCLL